MHRFNSAPAFAAGAQPPEASPHRRGHGHGAQQRWFAMGAEAGFDGGRGRRGGRGRGRGRGRARRGDVRAALLALLAEEPRHGYELMQELTERTSGVWRPSPGSVYPALAQLEDEGLITATEADGKRVFTLTDDGKAEVDGREGAPPWEEVNEGVGVPEASLGRQAGLVMAPVKLLRHVGTPAQQEAAAKILSEARRGLYRILAEDDPAENDPAEDASDSTS